MSNVNIREHIKYYMETCFFSKDGFPYTIGPPQKIKVLIFYEPSNTSFYYKSDVTTASVLTTTPTATTGTEAELDWEYKNCSSSSPCSLGEGNCDNDNQCRKGLVCGTDNCRDYSQHAHGDADCCIRGTNSQNKLAMLGRCVSQLLVEKL